MKLLITGARGQLGRSLGDALARGGTALGPVPEAFRAAEVSRTSHEDCDLSQQAQAAALIQDLSPDVVFHCAAFTQVDRCETEPDMAFGANALAARNVALAAQAVGAKLLHLSTDYVFDGTAQAPMPEWTLPNPQSVYGHSKWLGEQYVRNFCSRYFILRTAWLYGPGGPNFVETILRLGARQAEIRVVDDQLGNPTHAEDLAWHMLRIAATDSYGLYHVTGGGVCSWFDFAREIVRLSGLSTRVIPCSTGEYPRPARRPAYSALAHTMLAHTVGDHMRPWREALAGYLQGRDTQREEHHP